MKRRVSTKIKDLDFNFENSLVRIAANRNIPEIKLAGLSIGPFEEGNEYEVYYWAARELERSGTAQLRKEENIDATKLYKIQWTERAQTTGQTAKLPENFYPQLRRYLTELKMEITRNPEKLREYEKIKQLTQDTVNARLKKIVSLASTSSQSEQMLKNLTGEERFLYGQLNTFIREWKTRILECEATEK